MEDAVIAMVADGLSAPDFEGLLYVMGAGGRETYRPLYVGNAERRGVKNPVSANLVNLRVDRGKHGGPAAHAGVARGDLITQIDRQRVSNPSDVAEALATAKPGQIVRVAITKPDGSEATVKVTLGQYPGSGQ
jgi:S1-C subfamily serine protease